MNDHFEDESNFDFPRRRGEPCPPLLRNWPRKAITSFYWLPLSYRSKLSYLSPSLDYSFACSFVSSSNPLFIFFWRAASSPACFARRLLIAVSILSCLPWSKACFSVEANYCKRAWTLWASVYLDKKRYTFFVSPYFPPSFLGSDTQMTIWLWLKVAFRGWLLCYQHLAYASPPYPLLAFPLHWSNLPSSSPKNCLSFWVHHHEHVLAMLFRVHVAAPFHRHDELRDPCGAARSWLLTLLLQHIDHSFDVRTWQRGFVIVVLIIPQLIVSP